MKDKHPSISLAYMRTMPRDSQRELLSLPEEMQERKEISTRIDIYFYFTIACTILLALSKQVELTETHLIADSLWLTLLYTLSATHRSRIAQIEHELLATEQGVLPIEPPTQL